MHWYLCSCKFPWVFIPHAGGKWCYSGNALVVIISRDNSACAWALQSPQIPPSLSQWVYPGLGKVCWKLRFVSLVSLWSSTSYDLFNRPTHNSLVSLCGKCCQGNPPLFFKSHISYVVAHSSHIRSWIIQHKRHVVSKPPFYVRKLGTALRGRKG